MLALFGSQTRKLTISSGDLPSAQLSTSNASHTRTISIDRTISAFHAPNTSKVHSRKSSAPLTSMYRTPAGKAVSVANNIPKSAPAALKSPIVSPKATFYDSITAERNSRLGNVSNNLKSASSTKQKSSSSIAVAVNNASPATTDKPAATTDASNHRSSTASAATDHQLYRVMRVPKDKHTSTCLRQIATSRKKGPGVMFKKSRKVKNGSIVKILQVVHNEEGCFAEISVFSSKKRKKAKPKKTGFVPRRYLSPVTTPHDKSMRPRLSVSARHSSKVLISDPSFTEGKIPKLLAVMWCALLSHDGLKMEGILRRSADKTLIQEVQKGMIAGVHTMSVAELAELCPNALCAGNLIKLFFRNLKPKLMDAFDGDVLDGMAGCDDADFAATLQSTLPENQLHLFHWIMDRCLDILAHSEHNRMTGEALGIVFAPNLFTNITLAIGQGNRFFVRAIQWRKRTLREIESMSPVSGIASAAASAIADSLDTIDGNKVDHSSEDDLSSEDSDTGDRVDSPST